MPFHKPRPIRSIGDCVLFMGSLCRVTDIQPWSVLRPGAMRESLWAHIEGPGRSQWIPADWEVAFDDEGPHQLEDLKCLPRGH